MAEIFQIFFGDKLVDQEKLKQLAVLSPDKLIRKIIIALNGRKSPDERRTSDERGGFPKQV